MTSTVETTTEVQPGQLTRDDLTAFKLADTVQFTYSPGRHEYLTGIRLHLDGGYGGNPRIWTAREQRLFPEVVSHSHDRHRDIEVPSMAWGYGQAADSWGDGTGRERLASCHWSRSSARFHHPLQTIIGLLRSGDELYVEWVADNNNDLVREAGLHVDELHLHVNRKGTDRPLRFVVGTQVCADNSARMIKRHG